MRLFVSDISEQSAEVVYHHIQELANFECYNAQKTFSLDKIFSPLDSLVAASGHEKLFDQLNIFQAASCARIRAYLNLPEFAKKGIKRVVSDFIQLIDDREQGNRDSDTFARDATRYIQQIRQAIPKYSLGWLLLDKIAVCVALIVLPIAIINGVYHKAMRGKVRLGFFDTQTRESKYINHIEAVLNQRPSFA